MASNTHTILQVVQTVGFMAGDVKDRFGTITNPDPAVEHLIYCINAAFRAMNRRKPVRNESDYYNFVTVAPYTTGTVSVTEGSDTITGSGTSWNMAWTSERAFATATDDVAYRISAVASTTSATLDTVYVGATDSGEAYSILTDRYSLEADFSDILYATYDGPSKGDINLRQPHEMDRQRFLMQTSSAVTGRPTDLTIWGKDANNNWLLELNPFPDDVYRIQLRITNQPAKIDTSSDTAIVPVDDESIDTLIAGALAMWQEKDTPGAFQAWKSGGLEEWVVFDQKKTDIHPQIVPDDALRPQNAMGRRRPKDPDFFGR